MKYGNCSYALSSEKISTGKVKIPYPQKCRLVQIKILVQIVTSIIYTLFSGNISRVPEIQFQLSSCIRRNGCVEL